MAKYIQNLDHLINYIRMNYRITNKHFTEETLCLLVEFWEWSETYTKGYAIEQLTWQLKEYEAPITDQLLESIKESCKENFGQRNLETDISKVFLLAVGKLMGKPGVYFLYDKNKKLLYIGRSFSLGQRVLSSIKERSSGRPHYAGFIETKTKPDACVLEAYYIAKMKPAMNSDMADIEPLTIELKNPITEIELFNIYDSLKTLWTQK